MDLAGESMNEEIVIEVLKTLRVKSLLRFMCVSKLWCNLINDPYFVASHLQLHKKSSSPHLEVLLCRSSKDFDYFRLTKTPKTVSEHLKIQFPWNPINPKPNASVIGHCDGVVCVREYSKLIICNPVTRRFRFLPESCVDRTMWNETREAVGFGFLDDLAYKVVRVIYDIEVSYSEGKVYERPWAEVYDSRFSSWRSAFVDIDLSCHRVSDGVYNPFDGCLYWIGRGFGENKGSTALVSFELGEEKWQEILFPNEIANSNDEGEDVSVRMVGEYVAMVFNDRSSFRVWKMEREGDETCWTLMHNTNIDYEFPRGFCNDGKHLLATRTAEGCTMVVRDSNNVNDAGFWFAYHNKDMGNVVSDFVESLLLLDGESDIGNGYVRVIVPKRQKK